MPSEPLLGLSTGEIAVLLGDEPNETSTKVASTIFADIPNSEIVGLLGASALAARELVQPRDNGDYELRPPAKQVSTLFHEAHFWILCNGTRQGQPDAIRIIANRTLVAAFQRRAFGTYFGSIVEKELANPEPPSIPALAALEDFINHCDGEVTTQLFTTTAPATTFTGPHDRQLEQLRAHIG